MTLLRRVYEHPKFIPVLGLVSVVAFALAVFGVVKVLAEDDARERERIASDLASCLRGNVLRSQVRDIGQADQAMVQGILDVVFPEDVGSPRITDIRARLAPILNEHALAVAEVALTDCEKAVPGAVVQPLITEEPPS